MVMRPSNHFVLEPGLERAGVRDCDLFSFVTSAAVHMMRTLQKPSRKRPSKRQVNHRRFLHNMIQRKFADIEAANQRLASALLLTTEDNISPSSPSHNLVTPDPPIKPITDDCLCEAAKDPVTNTAKHTDQRIQTVGSDSVCGSGEIELNKMRQLVESRHLWGHLPKSQSNTGRGKSQGDGAPRLAPRCISYLNSPEHIGINHKPGLFQIARSSVEKSSQRTCMDLSEDSVYPASLKETDNNNNKIPQVKSDSNTDGIFHLDGDFNIDLSVSPSSSFSPDLSLLSLDSCDFSHVQPMLNGSPCLQDLCPSSSEDTVENQWTDMMDLLQTDLVSGEDSEVQRDCVIMEDFSENAYRFQDGDWEFEGGEVCCEDITTSCVKHASETCTEPGTFQIQNTVNCSSEAEHLKCKEVKDGGVDDCKIELGFTINNHTIDQKHSHSVLAGQSETAVTETPSDIDIDNQPNPHSVFSHYNSTLNMNSGAQHMSSCAFKTCDSNTGTPFEGVAQSFSAPTERPLGQPTLIPPFENDWLFMDIV